MTMRGTSTGEEPDNEVEDAATDDETDDQEDVDAARRVAKSLGVGDDEEEEEEAKPAAIQPQTPANRSARQEAAVADVCGKRQRSAAAEGGRTR